MPYSKSSARIDFDNTIKQLLSKSRKASFNNAGISYAHKIMIFQSSIFLLSASFEGYLKSLIEDMIFQFSHENAILSDLPENFRSMILLDSQLSTFKAFIHSGDEVKTLTKLKTSNNCYKIIHDNHPFTNQIRAGQIIGTKKYPSIKNLNILFNRIGIRKIINEINRKGQKNYELDLKSFLDIRETLAHDIAPSVTFVDVQRHYKNISEIIRMLDRVTYSHIVKISGEKFWKNN